MEKSWINVFQDTVKLNYDKVAIIHKDSRMTFRDVDHTAKQIATLINDVWKGSNRPILVLLPKSARVICSNIAIIYSCNIFSNLDIKTPRERLNNIISVLDPVGIITDDKGMDLCDIPDDIFVINLDKSLLDKTKEIDTELTEEKLRLQIDTDPFCIINTSGSTGTPKGVILNHRSFFDFIYWSLEAFGFDGSEVIGALSPVVFDIYDYEMCLMMKTGATIVILDAGLAAFPVRLLEHLQQNNVSFLFWVPTIMVNIANMDLLSRIKLDSLKTIWFAGEVFPTKQFNYWKKMLPNTLFANLYGPIEITLDCTYYIVDRDFSDNEALPIGIPCQNTDIIILNDEDQLCEDDEEGELCVRGTSLAMGYYNNPEKTRMAFVQNPLNRAYPELIYRTGDIVFKNSVDGLIYFKGRKDSLIKHMGYRIELNEIEHVIVNQLKMVKNCCAVYDKTNKEIVLFYENGDYEENEMRKILAGQFPKYMIPTVWKRIDELPRNTNGKIDRLALSNRVNL